LLTHFPPKTRRYTVCLRVDETESPPFSPLSLCVPQNRPAIVPSPPSESGVLSSTFSRSLRLETIATKSPVGVECSFVDQSYFQGRSALVDVPRIDIRAECPSHRLSSLDFRLQSSSSLHSPTQAASSSTLYTTIATLYSLVDTSCSLTLPTPSLLPHNWSSGTFTPLYLTPFPRCLVREQISGSLLH